MHSAESVVENRTHKPISDFDIHTDHRIPSRRPDRIIINKKGRTRRIVDFAALMDHRVKIKESEKKE